MSEPIPEDTENGVMAGDGPQGDLPQEPGSVFGEDDEDD